MEPIVAPSARKRAISDADLLHAYDNAIRAVEGDEGFTMIVGPSRTGALLEIGVVTGGAWAGDRARHDCPSEVSEVMRVPRTMQEILDHADQLAARFENDDFGAGEGRDAAPLRALRAAVLARSGAEHAVAERVHDVREAGLSWAAIGAYLGTSGEAARQRYGRPVTAR